MFTILFIMVQNFFTGSSWKLSVKILNRYALSSFNFPIFDFYLFILFPWPHASGGCWADSSTGYPAVLWGGKLGKGGIACGYTPHWRKQWLRRDCSRWISTSPSARTQSCSSLRPGPLWTYVWWRSRDRGHRYTSIGGNRTGCMRRGCGQRLVRRNRRRGGEETDGAEVDTDLVGGRIM